MDGDLNHFETADSGSIDGQQSSSCVYLYLVAIILTLESVAQSLQSVDLWYTTGLSSGAPGSPGVISQRHKCLCNRWRSKVEKL